MENASIFAEALIIVCVFRLSALVSGLLFETHRESHAHIRFLLYAVGIAAGVQLGGLSREQEIWTAGISGALALLAFGAHYILWTLRRRCPKP